MSFVFPTVMSLLLKHSFSHSNSFMSFLHPAPSPLSLSSLSLSLLLFHPLRKEEERAQSRQRLMERAQKFKADEDDRKKEEETKKKTVAEKQVAAVTATRALEDDKKKQAEEVWWRDEIAM